jgi:hypothetical protein
MRCRWVLLAAVLLAGCGASESSEKKAATPRPPAPVRDDRLLLLPAHQTAARIVPDHLLGKMALPGGTIGDYDDGGKKYQLFIVETATAQDAAFLLLDFKPLLKDPAYISYMGGYFGPDATSGTPVWVFSKSKYLAGVVGLARDPADATARELAARLR